MHNYQLVITVNIDQTVLLWKKSLCETVCWRKHLLQVCTVLLWAASELCFEYKRGLVVGGPNRLGRFVYPCPMTIFHARNFCRIPRLSRQQQSLARPYATSGVVEKFVNIFVPSASKTVRINIALASIFFSRSCLVDQRTRLNDLPNKGSRGDSA